MPANLENSAVATELEKVSFHSSPKERQCQRMFKLTAQLLSFIKKAEWQRIDAFELWCWRRLLRIPWTVRFNQSILMEISPEYSLEGLMLKLKFQYFGHLM